MRKYTIDSQIYQVELKFSKPKMKSNNRFKCNFIKRKTQTHNTTLNKHT